MNELLKTKLYKLLPESSQQVTNQEIQNTYVRFMERARTTVS